MKAPSTFTVGEPPESKVSEWRAELARRLTDFVGQVARALNGGLTMEDNARAQWVSLTWIGGSTDLAVRTFSTPRATILVQCVPEDGSLIGSAIGLEWEPYAGGIRVRAINGLTSGTRYAVTLLVVER